VRHARLINYALYQAGWFACVLGAAWHRPWAGFLIALTLVGAHLALSDDRGLEARLVVLAATVGLVVEMTQIAGGTYRIASGSLVDALPAPWLMVLWAQFATTFRFSLRAVMLRPLRAAALGAAGGPLAFLAGERLEAVVLLPPLTHSLLRLALCWGVALLVFSMVVRRVTTELAEPRYRSAT
jgi:hypothetical protein